MKASLRTSKGVGILVGIIFGMLLSYAGVWLDSIIFGYTTAVEASTMFYIKIYSLPMLLDVIVGSVLIKINWKAIGLTVIIVGIAMSPVLASSLVILT